MGKWAYTRKVGIGPLALSYQEIMPPYLAYLDLGGCKIWLKDSHIRYNYSL